MSVSFVALVPIVTGILAVYLITTVADTRLAVKGVVGPFFGALAIMFALFASLMSGETWREISRANALVAKEVNTLIAIDTLAQSFGEGEARIRELTKRYAEQDIATDKQHMRKSQISLRVLPALIELQNFVLKGEVSSTLLKSRLLVHIDDLRNLRLQRLEIKRDHSGPRKLAMLILLGSLTQIAIAMCHAENKSATIYTVGLFTIAFVVIVNFVTVFDNPGNFERVVNLSVLLQAV